MNKNGPVYLDYNSTTPVHPEVLEEMLPYLRENFGNPSSAHSLGRKAKARIEEAREKTAALVGADPREIIFCSGGTESDNLALKGAAWSKPRDGSWTVLTSPVEHSAVLKTAEYLAGNGYRRRTARVYADGTVDLASVSEMLDEKVAVVSVMHSNNETGTIQPVAEISKIARKRGVPTHSDAVQSAGKVRLDVRELGVDFLSLSAHKLYGPKGVGCLYVRNGVKIGPIVNGGGHERGLRAGTENVAGIIGFGKACEIAAKKIDSEALRISALRDDLEKRLLSAIPSAFINGRGGRRLPNTTNICFAPGIAEAVMIKCDLAGIAVSGGSACASGSIEPSHVLMAMGVSRENALGSIRISLGAGSTPADVEYAARMLPKITAEILSANSRQSV
ncbi:MAG: cysteine desulfurase [Nitrospinae bacterium]|nr:cysteine desulfurase [Nitrospinota bacterium]